MSQRQLGFAKAMVDAAFAEVKGFRQYDYARVTEVAPFKQAGLFIQTDYAHRC